jgi:hypothetical protein
VVIADVCWLWRTVPKWSAEDGNEGIAAGELEAKRAAEAALSDQRMISAICQPFGRVYGRWQPAGQPSIGLRTVTGTVRWFDDVHGRGVAHLAGRDAGGEQEAE